MMTSTVVHGEGRWELQYASDHFSAPPNLFSRPYINPLLTFFHFACFSVPFSATLLNFSPSSAPADPFTGGRGGGGQSGPTEPGSQQMAAVPVVCERSVLSKQTHWAICFSTLHQAGCSEESAHHFNQPPQPPPRTMNS